MTERGKARPLTLGAYRRGEGTKRERDRFRAVVVAVGSDMGATVRTFLAVADALHAAGVPIVDDDDLNNLEKRHSDDPRAKPILNLLSDVKRARSALLAKQMTARKNASQPRKGVTPEQAVAYVARFARKYGTERGAITAGAAHFEMNRRTFAGLLNS